jgi:tripartite-type tricarboxylate transporter receptor subunit TctC
MRIYAAIGHAIPKEETVIRFLMLLTSLGAASCALAQSYPERAVRVIVPWPPGQATDIVGRVMAQKLSESLGQPFVVDNRAGAGGMIGTEAAARAQPDGYTLLAGSSGPVTVNPLLQKVAYDVDKQFVAVHLIGVSPYVLVTHPSFPAAGVKELIGVLRANPGKYSFSSSGTGATAHLVTEWFNSRAQIKVLHVPYKGSAPSLTDIVSGQIAYSMETLAATNPLVKSGKLKAYAISVGRRNAALPDVPTLIESADWPDFDVGAWLGWLLQTGTPPEIVARLSAESDRILQTAEVRERLAFIGLDVDSRRAEPFAAYLKVQQARFADIIREGKIRLE